MLVADLPGKILALDDSTGSLCPSSNRGSSISGGQDAVEVGFLAYTDDAVCWAAARSPELVGAMLEQILAVLVAYASKNYLALNEEKT